MSDERKNLADLIAKEHEARENQKATRQALATARTHRVHCEQSVTATEYAITKARENDPDELVAAARAGRAPHRVDTHELRIALAAARDELSAAENAITELQSRIPDAEMQLSAAKSSTQHAVGQVIRVSPEYEALIERMRRHEQELGTCYTVLNTISKGGLYGVPDKKFDPAGNGDLGAARRMHEAADPETMAAWRQAMTGLMTDAQTPLPAMNSSTELSKNSKPKRSLFTAR